jgi:hypothetical protein
MHRADFGHIPLSIDLIEKYEKANLAVLTLMNSKRRGL